MDSMAKSQFSANNEDSSSSDEDLPKQQSLIESLPPADYQSKSDANAIPNRSAPSFYDNVRPVVVAKQVDIGSDDELSGSNWSDDQSSQGSYVEAKKDAPRTEPEIGVTVNGELGLGNELISATPAKKFLEKIKSVAVGESFSWGEESYKKLFEPIWV
ncbi:unnamed protein product [Oikopleura dioica]|uniref:Uncharacterized protein n=1 Tax=Oikopleura dioica TaxID=34765 RepID=E4YN01_OIKDI|nr:unnamed protein product [Oikopleura dioica]